MRWSRPWLVLAIAGCLAALTAPARADTQPWSVGVTEAKKAEAQTSLEAGNALFLDRKYAEALEKYRAAVAAWDHPAIRFNIVRCLIQLDKPVEASDNLKQALRYGAAPLQDTVYAEALAYEKLLAQQIGDLTLRCTQPDVRVTLDGQPLATCPATETRRVSPGPHQLVGTKPGLLPKTVEIVVLGGKAQEVALQLDPLGQAARIEHRWASWKPWVVFAAGFAVVGIGGVVDFVAFTDMDSYDRTIAQNCSVMACAKGDPRLATVQHLRDNAELTTKIAGGVMIVGAATVATGAVMLYMNRGRTVYPRSIEKLGPAVTPTTGGAVLSLSGRF